jgi:hypothetical protein
MSRHSGMIMERQKAGKMKNEELKMRNEKVKYRMSNIECRMLNVEVKIQQSQSAMQPQTINNKP